MVCQDHLGRPTHARLQLGAANLPSGATADEVAQAIRDLLEDPKLFRVCAECHERQADGWMHDNRICQGYAERNHGVVH